MAKNILGFPWDSFTLLQEDIAPSYNWIRGPTLQAWPLGSSEVPTLPFKRRYETGVFTSQTHTIQVPIGSMYGIYTIIWLIFVVNVAKYTIHGCYGVWYFYLQLVVVKGKIMVNVGKSTIHGWYGKRMENYSWMFRVLLLAVRIRFQWG